MKHKHEYHLKETIPGAGFRNEETGIIYCDCGEVMTIEIDKNKKYKYE